MGIELHHEKKAEYLYVRITGEFSTEETCSSFVDTLGSIDYLKATKILIDCRQLTGVPQSMDYDSYGTFVAGELRKRSKSESKGKIHLAYVIDSVSLDGDPPNSISALDDDVDVLVVDDIGEALRWLNVVSEDDRKKSR